MIALGFGINNPPLSEQNGHADKSRKTEIHRPMVGTIASSDTGLTLLATATGHNRRIFHRQLPQTGCILCNSSCSGKRRLRGVGRSIELSGSYLELGSVGAR